MGVIARFVSVESLLVMKREAGRNKDLADMDALLKIYESSAVNTLTIRGSIAPPKVQRFRIFSG